MKLLLFIKAFCFFDLQKNYRILVIGPIGYDLLKLFFTKNYFYSSINFKVPVNLSILPLAFYYLFRTLLTNQNFFFSKWKLMVYLCLMCSLIKKKKINKIISFALYNGLPNFIKIVLKENIEIIKIQNGAGIDNRPFLKSDTNFVYSEKDKIKKNKKIYTIGNLRLLLHLSKQKLWKYLKQKTLRTKNIVLISSATIDVINFIDGFFEKKREELFNFCKNYEVKKLKADEDWLELRSVN